MNSFKKSETASCRPNELLCPGSWARGTAVAIYLSKQSHVVTLVPRRMEHALRLSSERTNEEYLPSVAFTADMQVGCSLRPVVMESDYLFMACPSHALRETCRSVLAFKDDFAQLKGVIALCKGLEPETNKFAHEVIQEEFGSTVRSGYLTGPSHALDVGRANRRQWSWQWMDRRIPSFNYRTDLVRK